MGRTGIAARPAVGLRLRCSWAGRAFAVVLASIALLLCGVVEVLPRSAAAASPATSSAAAAPAVSAPSSRAVPGTSRAGSLEAPASSLAVRAAGLAAVPAPTGPGSGLPATSGPLVAPHLLADPQGRPPTWPLATAPAGTPGSRAPPGPAGT